MMLVHAFAFILYNAVIIVYYVFMLRYMLTDDAQTRKQLYISWCVC